MQLSTFEKSHLEEERIITKIAIETWPIIQEKIYKRDFKACNDFSAICVPKSKYKREKYSVFLSIYCFKQFGFLKYISTPWVKTRVLIKQPNNTWPPLKRHTVRLSTCSVEWDKLCCTCNFVPRSKKVFACSGRSSLSTRCSAKLATFASSIVYKIAKSQLCRCCPWNATKIRSKVESPKT